MASVQLSFGLRTSGSPKTVHLLGSWDNYQGQLPLSKDSAKKGGWKGTFRFQGSMLNAGQRYWYYYIIDGYQVSHDPAKPSTTEPTTGRALNILDVPASASVSQSSSSSSSRTNRTSREIPRGRPLSISKIQHPTPVKPNQTRYLTETYEDEEEEDSVEALTSRFSTSTIDEEDYYRSYPASAPYSPSSVGSSLSSRSDSSSPSSTSSISDYASPTSSVCTCERYGITRAGDRVKLDCGGSRCSFDDDSSSCSDSDKEEIRYSAGRARR
jgi:hypothetical protein